MTANVILLNIPNNENTMQAMETEPSAPQKATPNSAPFKVLETVYIRESDGLMYKAIIRRALFGYKFQRAQAQLAMGEDIDDEEDEENEDVDDAVAMWHYFVHFPGWKVMYDRWASAPDVFVVDTPTTMYAEGLAKEHRALHKRMSSGGNRRLKRHQRVNAIKFLAEWSKRMHQITAELPEGALKQALERWQLSRKGSLLKDDEMKEKGVETRETSGEQEAQNTSSTSTTAFPKKRRNMSLLPLPPEFVKEEKNLRRHGLAAKQRSKVSITLPFGLKKTLVEQWELICQCDMLPVLPSKFTIRQALEAYVASKNSDTAAPDNCLTKNGPESPSNVAEISSSNQVEEWRVMADGIAQMFNESLPVRLLYAKEVSQFDLNVKGTDQDYTTVYGCEHLLRLFVKLPDIIGDNLPHQQCRPIVAKVNDLARFLHKNHAAVFQQQNIKQAPPNGPSPAKKQKLVVGDDTNPSTIA